MLEFMLNFYRSGGAVGWLLVILTFVILVLVLWKVVKLSTGTVTPGVAWEAGLNAILFWGAFAAVLGFLSQCLGIYNMMVAISRADEIAPGVVAQGFLISFTPTLLGLVVLAFSALCWYGLRAWSQRLAARLARA